MGGGGERSVITVAVILPHCECSGAMQWFCVRVCGLLAEGCVRVCGLLAEGCVRVCGLLAEGWWV